MQYKNKCIPLQRSIIALLDHVHVILCKLSQNRLSAFGMRNTINPGQPKDVFLNWSDNKLYTYK
jgi:hypothetical protein